MEVADFVGGTGWVRVIICWTEVDGLGLDREGGICIAEVGLEGELHEGKFGADGLCRVFEVIRCVTDGVVVWILVMLGGGGEVGGCLFGRTR